MRERLDAELEQFGAQEGFVTELRIGIARVGVLVDRLDHGQTLERLAQIEFAALVGEGRGAERIEG